MARTKALARRTVSLSDGPLSHDTRVEENMTQTSRMVVDVEVNQGDDDDVGLVDGDDDFEDGDNEGDEDGDQKPVEENATGLMSDHFGDILGANEENDSENSGDEAWRDDVITENISEEDEEEYEEADGTRRSAEETEEEVQF